MLRRIRLKNFKSFADLDLELGPINVLFGPNASGKSNLLDALQLLSRLVQVERVWDAFQWPYRGTPLEAVRGGFSDPFGDEEPKGGSFEISVDVKLSPDVVAEVEALARTTPHSRLQYSVKVAVNPETAAPAIASERASRLDKRWRRSGEPLLDCPEGDPAMLGRGHRHAGTSGHVEHYVRADYSALAGTLGEEDPDLRALRLQLSRFRLYILDPRGAVRERTRLEPETRLDPQGGTLAAFLVRLREDSSPRFDSIVRTARTAVPGLTGIRVERTRTGALELWVEIDGKWTPAELLSDGTIRMLQIIAIVGNPADKANIIGLEEPENGIHPMRISLVADILKTQEILGHTTWIVATHSPVLLDRLPDQYLYVCRRVGGGSEILPFAEADPFRRRQLIDEALRDEEPDPVGYRVRRGDFGG